MRIWTKFDWKSGYHALEFCIFVAQSAAITQRCDMYYRNSILITLICLLSVLLPCKKVLSQQSARDSLNISIFYPAYSIALPFADLKERFGLSHTIGGGYSFLTKSRWMFTAEGNFLFGGNVKNLSSVLAGIMTSDGHVINEEGTFANLAVTERGFTFWLKAGRLFPLKKMNPNSGILVMAGAGMMQHKIRIDVSQNNTPQLRSDYKKGYDRLCNGPAITQFIGYQHIDNNKRLNFFGGIEVVEAWTKSRRPFYFADRLIPNEKRFDMQVGIKIGWLVPLYRKTGREYYYY